jgi:hypothetical protein
MSFKDCMAEAVKGEEISRDQADRLEREFERFRAAYLQDAPAMADQLAKEDLAKALKSNSDHARRKAKLAMANIRQTAADLNNHRTAAGKKDLGAAAILKLENYGEAKFSSVAGRTMAIVGMAHARMDELLVHFRRGAIGGDLTRWNKADLKNVVREAFGVDTGDAAAKGFARSWTETAEWLRRRFNAAGGAIGKLENWGLPQAHDDRALRRVGRQAWKDFITPRLDPAKMRHPLTGRPVDTREMDKMLDEVFDSITTGGWNRRKPSRIAIGSSLANQRAEHRFLAFRDPDAWLEYQDAFGGGDAYGAMTRHISMMARDIAAMEVLGPNPGGTLEWMKQAVTKAAAGNEAAMRRAERQVYQIDTLWKSIRGDLGAPVNQLLADSFGTARALITASVLGSAMLSATGDLATGAMARWFSGIPARSTLKQAIKGLTSTSQREAVQAGLILDSAMNVLHQEARHAGAIGAPAKAQFLADRVLALSGLTAWTQAGRHAFGLAFMTEAAKHAAKPLDQMPDALRRTFERHGFTARQWDLMRQMKAHEAYDGRQILRPAEIAERTDPKLAERYLEMIQAETEFAVPTGGHRAKTFFSGQTRAGTLVGELLRNFAQFKSFGIAFLFLHGARTVRELQAGRVANAATYAGGVLIGATLMGAAAVQLKQVAAGRDPRPMDDSTFWGAAALQGGAFGLYGDFMFSNLNRFGGGLASSIASPVAQRAEDLLNLSLGNVQQLYVGEPTNAGRELVRFARGNVPGGTIWYLRLAWEREVLDQLQFLADPEANKAFKRQQQRWRKDYGQDFYWRPGERLPDRGPDMGGMLRR